MAEYPQQEVDEFMAADKVVPGDRPMVWSDSVPSRRVWHGPVEVDGQRIGQVYFLATPALIRSVNFQLSYRGTVVYRIDVRPRPSGHSNPRGCPADRFPKRNLKACEHEHMYVEGIDCKCARDLENCESSGDIEIFDVFCQRARIRFEPPYESPFLNAPVPLF